MHPIFQLMRFDKPVGIWLVFLPAGIAVALAAQDFGDVLVYEFLMVIGAVLTRAAGCIVNDLTDQELDKQVARTQHRPLAAGTVSRNQAFVLLALLLVGALLIALMLPSLALMVSFLAVPMIFAYPHMKRYTWWPQVFLGLTFNMSALIGWAATNTNFGVTAFLLYAAALLWTLAYDTIYAVQDMADDAEIGILSSARALGINGIKPFVTRCYGVAAGLMLVVGILAHAGVFYYIGLAVAVYLARKIIAQLPCSAEAAGPLFRYNQWLGLAIFVGALLDRLIVF